MLNLFDEKVESFADAGVSLRCVRVSTNRTMKLFLYLLKRKAMAIPDIKRDIFSFVHE
jgi:hypothetical protein